MKKQAAEAKPETKDIKADEQKPKVPVPQWAGVGEFFRENLETSDPGLSNQPQLYLCKRWFQKCPETSEPNSTSFAPASTLGPTCTSGRSRNAPARTLTQLLNPGPTTVSTFVVPTRS